MMYSHLSLPQDGNLNQLFHMFVYLKKYHNTEMVYEPSSPVIEESVFDQEDWTSSEFLHVQRKYYLPTNTQQPRCLGLL